MSILLCILSILMSVAFITLFERHLLSITQNRLGPNKVSLMGVLQPILDGIKLLSKQDIVYFNLVLFLISPSIAFILMFFEWMTLPLQWDFMNFKTSLLFFLCCMGFMVYTTLLSGVSSGSKFSFIGGIRASCQTISYEVAISLLLLIILIHQHSLKFISNFSLLFLLTLGLWLICLLAETSRAPFDFSEGESELVSGFNTEYGSVLFVLLFLSEYGSIILFSFMTSVIWMSSSFFFSLLIFSFVLIVRSSFPRFRYDFLMKLVWMKILPITLFILIFSLSLWGISLLSPFVLHTNSDFLF